MNADRRLIREDLTAMRIYQSECCETDLQTDDDSQRIHRNVAPLRALQPDRESAGFCSRAIHAVSLLPAGRRVNAKHPDMRCRAMLVQAGRARLCIDDQIFKTPSPDKPARIAANPIET
jgi:hypothetical protein